MARSRGTRVLVRAEANGLTERRAGLAALFRKVCLRAYFRGMSAFLTIGTLNAEFYGRFGVPPDKLFRTPYAVDNDFFASSVQEHRKQRAVLLEREGLPNGGPVLLFCGKVIPS